MLEEKKLGGLLARKSLDQKIEKDIRRIRYTIRQYSTYIYRISTELRTRVLRMCGYAVVASWREIHVIRASLHTQSPA